MDIVDVVIRSSIVYVFIVLAIRFFGKREISQLSVIDLVFILLISNSVQNAMVGPSTSLLSGIIAAATLFGINRILSTMVQKNKKFGTFLQGSPIMLMYQGNVIADHLRQADITMEELDAAIREHGIEDKKDVDLAILEIDGNISVLSHDFQRKTTKKRRAHKAIERSS